MKMRVVGGISLIACLVLLVPPAKGEHFKIVEPVGGQLVGLADLKSPNELLLHLGLLTKKFLRRIDLDGPDYWCFEREDLKHFVQWPLGVPGFARFGTGGAGGIVWKGTEYRVVPFGPPVGTKTLVSRAVVPNPPLPPLTVSFPNTHTEDLIVGFADLRRHEFPPRPAEHTIPRGTTAKFSMARDAGAVLETVWDVVLPPGEVVRQVERLPIAPQQIWDLVVWELKVTYRVVGQPELDMKTRRSLGVLYLPAGADLSDTIDVYREALRANNPGAASAYANPTP